MKKWTHRFIYLIIYGKKPIAAYFNLKKANAAKSVMMKLIPASMVKMVEIRIEKVQIQ
jgi:hypothetical protein